MDKTGVMKIKDLMRYLPVLSIVSCSRNFTCDRYYLHDQEYKRAKSENGGVYSTTGDFGYQNA